MLEKILDTTLPNILLSAELSSPAFRIGSGVHGTEMGGEDSREIEPWELERVTIPDT